MVQLVRQVKRWFDTQFRRHPYAWGWSFAMSTGVGLALVDVFTKGLRAHLGELLQVEQLVYHFGLPFILGASAARHGKKLREKAAREVAETERNASEEKHRTLVSNIPGIVYRIHLRENNRVEFFSSDQLELFTGYQPDQLPAGTVAALESMIAEAERAHVVGAVQKAIADNETYELSFAVNRRDGQRRHMLDRGQVVRDEQGPQYVDGVVLDITDRVLMQEMLAQERDFAEGLIDTTPVVVLVANTEGRILRANRYTTELLGWTTEQLQGHLAHEFIPSEEREDIARQLLSVMRDGTPARGISHMLTRDGTPREISWHMRKLWHTGAEGASILAVGLDITEQRTMEEQLRQSEKLQALGQLAGGIAHDFNNQLSGILGYADLLQERIGDNEKLQRYAESISLAARRAADLTGKLLAFARKGKYRTLPVDVHSIIAEVVTLLERSIDRRISVEQLLRAYPPVTMGDPTQLQNAILNLALNARDAMKDGGKLVFETDLCVVDGAFCDATEFSITPGAYLQVNVRDTGHGIDEGVRSRIFEPFFTTKDPGQGTGMGLAAVYGTVKAHHGAITVTSSPGNGSTFTLYFPASEATRTHGVSFDAGKQVVRGSGRILLVDDEDVVREMTAEMLTSLGYEVHECATGLEAVWHYREHSAEIDLVVLDLVMPQMSGREAYAAIRQIDPQVKVLLASGYSVDGEAQGILLDGAKGFLQKPYRKAELSQKVAEALGVATPSD